MRALRGKNACDDASSAFWSSFASGLFGTKQLDHLNSREELLDVSPENSFNHYYCVNLALFLS